MGNWVRSLLNSSLRLANQRHVGYDKAPQPIQVLPRKVSKITQPVLSITITVCMNCSVELGLAHILLTGIRYVMSAPDP